MDWWRKRKRAEGQEAEAVDETRRVDESDAPVPSETYLSQTRD